MRIVALLFNIVCFKFCFSLSYPNHLQMISDVITAYEQPTLVIARICWKPLHVLSFTKMLMTKERPTSIRFLLQNETIDTAISKNVNQLYLVDTNCEDSKNFLRQASTLKMYSKLYRWLVIGSINTLVAELTDVNILVDSEFVIAEKLNDKGFLLQAVYKIKTNSEWIMENYGIWTADLGLNKSQDRMISNAMRRRNLEKITITTSLVITDNGTITDYNGVNNIIIDSITKNTFSAVKNIYYFLNATEAVLFSDTWGYPVNGTWSGMIAHIQKGEAELSGTIAFMTEERLDLLEYLRESLVPTPKIVFRQPPLSFKHNLFILPFAKDVWYSLGGFIVILIIILYVSAKWDIAKHEREQQKVGDQTCLRATWSDIIIFLLSAVSQQGSTNEYKGNPGRLAMFIVFLSFVFLYTSYSACIVVLLQSTSDEIRTLSDLTNSKLEIGIEDVPYNRQYFSLAYANDPVRNAFYYSKVANKQNFMKIEEGVRRMQREPFAFNMNIATGYRVVSQIFQEHEKCGLQEIDYMRVKKAWFTSKKHSAFSEMYRVGFNRFDEHGFPDRNIRKFFAKKPLCSVSDRRNFGSVNLMDFYPVLMLLLYGMIIAFVLLVIEILFHRHQNQIK